MKHRIAATMFVIFAFTLACFAGDKLSPEVLVSKNADAIVTGPVSNAPLGRAGRGPAVRDVLLGGTGHREGQATFVSKQNTFQLVLDFNSAEYQGEQYTWDGSTARVGASGVDKFSALAQFVQLHDVLLREGLFGGVLNNGWALMTTAAHNPKLHYDGLKKYNGRQLHQLTYTPKKGDNDLTIRLYFEPDTFRHVASTYQFEGQTTAMAGHMLGAETVVERVEENFSDFKQENGLTLPHHWQLRYNQEHGSSMSVKFEMEFATIETGEGKAAQ